MKLLVLGIGQSLRGDDVAGLETVRLWQEKYPKTAERVAVELSELPGLVLLDLLEGKDAAILVDAVRSPESAGKIIRLGSNELASFMTDARFAHGWGVAETLHLGRAIEPSLKNCRITLLGIVGKDFSMGAGLSPQVNKVLDEAAELIEWELQNYISEI